MLFRLGGDEFALLIQDRDLSYCEALEKKILAMNGTCFTYAGQKIPLTIRVWISSNSSFQSAHELSEKLIYEVKHAWKSEHI